MEKIVIIGSSGAGKSTLARDLVRILHINVVHLDRVFWEPGWKVKPRETRIDILQEIVRKEQWIIEGTYLGSSEPRLMAADTIIFLDVHLLLSLLRIIKRHRPLLHLLRIIKQDFDYHEHIRRDIPNGCHDKLNLIRILKVLVFPIRGRLMIEQKLRIYKSKEIIWLHSTKDVEAFLAQQKAQANEKKQSSSMPSIPRKRQLVTAK